MCVNASHKKVQGKLMTKEVVRRTRRLLDIVDEANCRWRVTDFVAIGFSLDEPQPPGG